MLLDLANFALQGQPEDNLMVAISCRAWYNGSYTMAIKPIKMLELQYTCPMIHKMFCNIHVWFSTQYISSIHVLNQKAFNMNYFVFRGLFLTTCILVIIYYYFLQIKIHPKKLWVEKSNNHRGIHIKSPKGIARSQACRHCRVLVTKFD